MALMQLNFESKFLGCHHQVWAILPNMKRTDDPHSFYRSGKKYKVLWLLHGTYGDSSDWVRKTNIELYACEKNLVVIMPSAMNSNYANWPDFSLGYHMYDYLLDELMPLVYGWLPVSDKREDNYLAGLSMGGRGTWVYAFNHPEKFTAAAGLSGFPRNLELMKTMEPDFYARTLGCIANAGGEEAYLASYENTWRLAEEKTKTGELPRLYFAIGMDDDMYPAYLAFKEYAQKIGLEATFEEEPGYRHEWRFWDLYIQRVLDFFDLNEQNAGNTF